jgi:nitrogen fixation/metabolism regulation signal transduction histidine kinase
VARSPGEAGVTLKSRKLETRLLVSFLLLASVPSLLVTIIATGRLSGAITSLQNPGVEASFDHAATLYGELVDHLRSDAELVLEWLPAAPPPADEEALAKDLLAETNFDFAAYETAEGTRVITATGASFEDVEIPSSAEWNELAGDEDPETRRGRTLRFFRAASDGEAARAIGVVLEPELAVALVSAGEEYGFYQQLKIFEQVRMRWFWISSVGIFLLAATVAYLAARVTARRISRPVVELAGAADRIAAGDLSQRADVRAEGEIGDLVRAFNRMGERLERSRDELIRVERVAAWRDVARRIAHEVRNPLTPIKLAIHRLGGRVPPDSDAQECLRSIGEEVDNLARISESFSDFAKMPAPRFEPTDLAKIVKSVRELFQGAKAGIDLVYEGPDSVPLVADRDQIRRAVTNLVKNASEVMENGGTIRLEVTEGAGRATLGVSDEGPGIPDKIRDSILEPGISGKTGGSGLGLAMVHRIATDHRGTLKWTSTDRGAHFVLDLPVEPEESR